MNTRNARKNREETTGAPRHLNQSTIKDIEDIAYPEQGAQEPDVKIWIHQAQQKNNEV